jgi:ribosomal protein S18 acetylase RimI-like enzyme
LIKTTDISLEQVVDCHLNVFPDSLYNKFGKRFLVKTFSWYLRNPMKRKLLSFEKNNIVCGFLTMRMTDDKDSYYRYILPTFINSIIMFPKAILDKKFLSLILSPIITKNNSIVDSATMELVSLGVRIQNRNEGIATKLISEFERISKLSLSKTLILSVKEDNKNAIDFYFNHGWRINHSHKCNSNYVILKKEI